MKVSNKLPHGYATWTELYRTLVTNGQKGLLVEYPRVAIDSYEQGRSGRGFGKSERVVHEFDTDFLKARVMDELAAKLGDATRDEVKDLQHKTLAVMGYRAGGTGAYKALLDDVFGCISDICPD